MSEKNVRLGKRKLICGIKNWTRAREPLYQQERRFSKDAEHL